VRLLLSFEFQEKGAWRTGLLDREVDDANYLLATKVGRVLEVDNQAGC
jgi:hypothetical protein